MGTRSKFLRIRRIGGWSVRSGLTVAVPGLIALCWWSLYGQVRVFQPYGMCIALDQAVVVIEVERGQSVGERLSASRDRKLVSLLSGRVLLGRGTTNPFAPKLHDLKARQYLPRWNLSAPEPGKTSAVNYVTAPGWMVVLGVAGVAARMHVVAFRRRRRSGCEGCGYSLAGLAPDAACPECGRPRALPARVAG